MSADGQVMTAIEIKPQDWARFLAAVEDLRSILKDQLSPGWTFLEGHPAMTWNGIHLIKGR